MLRVLFLSLMVLTSACSHRRSSEDIKKFVTNWTEQFRVQDQQYASSYEKYLSSVENVYARAGKTDLFDSYLESLTNNAQILADQEEALPELYKNRTGRDIASNPDEYKSFIKSQMARLYNKLFTARELRIKDEVGDKLYSDLKLNYQNFMINNESDRYSFPL